MDAEIVAIGSSDLLGWIQLSRNGLVQANGQISRESWKGACINIKTAWGPNGAQFGLFVTGEVGPSSRTEKVCTKLSSDQRRNLRIAVFDSNGHRLK